MQLSKSTVRCLLTAGWWSELSLAAGFLPGGTRTLMDVVIVTPEQSARLFPTTKTWSLTWITSGLQGSRQMLSELELFGLKLVRRRRMWRRRWMWGRLQLEPPGRRLPV